MDDGVTIAAQESERPLGWNCDEYFYIKEIKITRGEWLLETQVDSKVNVSLRGPQVLQATIFYENNFFWGNITGLAILMVLFAVNLYLKLSEPS